MESKMHYLLGPDYENWTCHGPDYHNFITPRIIINKVIELSKEHFQGLSDKVIWDMFAGIGCDGLRFAKHSGKVICTELAVDTFSDLQSNIKYMDVCNVEAYNIDCSKASDINCNIIYFDPPWGDTFHSGQPFDFSEVKLDDGTPVLDLAHRVSQDHHLIIKAPISSDSFELLFDNRVDKILTFTQQKLKFLFVHPVNEIEY